MLAQHGPDRAAGGRPVSGVAVLFMGGVNAVENLAALPLPLFVVLAALGRPGGGRLVRWWLGAVAVAQRLVDAAPAGPRSVQPAVPGLHRDLGGRGATRSGGRTSRAERTTGSPSSSWAADPWWPGSYELATDALLIAVTGVVAAAGLWGLTRPHMPLRGPLLSSLLLGHALPDGRAVGTAGVAACRSSSRSCSTDRSRCCATSTRSTRWCASLWPWGSPTLTTVLLAGGRVVAGREPARSARPSSWSCCLVSAQPLWTGELRKPGWDASSAGLGGGGRLPGRAGGNRARRLVLPGSGFGQQGWGWTIDEPIQGLASTPWADPQPGAADPGRHDPQPRRHPGADRRRPGLAGPRRPLGARGHRVRAGAARPRPLRQRRTRPRPGGPRRLAEPGPGAGGVVRTDRLR